MELAYGERREVCWSVLIFGTDGRPDAGQAHGAEHNSAGEADPSEAFARGFAGCDAPFCGEEPDAVGKVPADGDHGDGVDGEHEWVRKLDLNFVECGVGMLGEHDAGEALPPDVLNNVGESDEAGVALGHVHPIA